jgi:hypothetical protein
MLAAEVVRVSLYVKNNNDFEQAEAVTRECPHCGASAQLIPVSTPSYEALMQSRPRHAGICFRCAACNEPRFARVAIRSFGPDRIELSSNVVDVERPRERFQFGYLPANVERLFRETLDCYTADLYMAFAVMCRRTIQAARVDVQGHERLQIHDLFKNAVALSEIDAQTAAALEAVLFGADEPELAPAPDEAAALIEIIKDVLYQRYVRNAKLKAAVRMRRYFAGEITQKITPIGVNKRQA